MSHPLIPSHSLIILSGPLPHPSPLIKHLIHTKYPSHQIISLSKLLDRLVLESRARVELYADVPLDMQSLRIHASQAFLAELQDKKRVILFDDESLAKRDIRKTLISGVKSLIGSREKPNYLTGEFVHCEVIEWRPLYGAIQLKWYCEYLWSLYDNQMQMRQLKEAMEVAEEEEHWRAEGAIAPSASLLDDALNQADIEVYERSLKDLYGYSDAYDPLAPPEQRTSAIDPFIQEEEGIDSYQCITEPLSIDREQWHFNNHGLFIEAHVLFEMDVEQQKLDWRLSVNRITTLFSRLVEQNDNLRFFLLIDKRRLLGNAIQTKLTSMDLLTMMQDQIAELELSFPIYTLNPTAWSESSTLQLTDTFFCAPNLGMISYAQFTHSLHLPHSLYWAANPSEPMLHQVFTTGIPLVRSTEAFFALAEEGNVSINTQQLISQHCTSATELDELHQDGSHALVRLSSSSPLAACTLYKMLQHIEYTPERQVFVSEDVTFLRFPLLLQMEHAGEMFSYTSDFTMTRAHSVVLHKRYLMHLLEENDFDHVFETYNALDLGKAGGASQSLRHTSGVTDTGVPTYGAFGGGGFDPEAALYDGHTEQPAPMASSQSSTQTSVARQTTSILNVNDVPQDQLPPLNMTLKDIATHFLVTYYQRGRDYYLNNHILEIMVNLSKSARMRTSAVSSFKIESTCQGSRDEPYRQETEIINGKLAREKCSCPLEHSCKHVIAQLLTYKAKTTLPSDAKPEDLFKPSSTTAGAQRTVSFDQLDPITFFDERIKARVVKRGNIVPFARELSGERAVVVLEDVSESASGGDKIKVLMFNDQCTRLHDKFKEGTVVYLSGFHLAPKEGNTLDIHLTDKTVVESAEGSMSGFVNSGTKRKKYEENWKKRVKKTVPEDDDLFGAVNFDTVPDEQVRVEKPTVTTAASMSSPRRKTHLSNVMSSSVPKKTDVTPQKKAPVALVPTPTTTLTPLQQRAAEERARRRVMRQYHDDASNTYKTPDRRRGSPAPTRKRSPKISASETSPKPKKRQRQSTPVVETAAPRRSKTPKPSAEVIEIIDSSDEETASKPKRHPKGMDLSRQLDFGGSGESGSSSSTSSSKRRVSLADRLRLTLGGK